MLPAAGIILLLVALNAFYVAGEFGAVGVRRSRDRCSRNREGKGARSAPSTNETTQSGETPCRLRIYRDQILLRKCGNHPDASFPSGGRRSGRGDPGLKFSGISAADQNQQAAGNRIAEDSVDRLSERRSIFTRSPEVNASENARVLHFFQGGCETVE